MQYPYVLHVLHRLMLLLLLCITAIITPSICSKHTATATHMQQAHIQQAHIQQALCPYLEEEDVDTNCINCYLLQNLLEIFWRVFWLLVVRWVHPSTNQEPRNNSGLILNANVQYDWSTYDKNPTDSYKRPMPMPQRSVYPGIPNC